MATFQVHYSRSLQSSQPCTSYVHLSGHSSAPLHNGVDESQMMEEEDGDYEGDQMLVDDASSSTGQRLATTGQAIASANSFMRGHGAYLASSSTSDGISTGKKTPLIFSSLCGAIHRTNKLISVTSLKSRYSPEVGDLVIGRIVELQPGNKRWKVNIQSRQDSNLLLSSINLPGGIQRRKLESDELEMRTFFKEGDLVVAEIQSIFTDGSTNLHTRSLNYGKLRNGQLIIMNSSLIRRLKSHFVRMEDVGLEVIIGLNGVIWVAMLNKAKINVTTGTGRDIEAVYSDINEEVPSNVRRRISRMLDLLAIFSCHHLPITDIAIARAFDVANNLVPLDANSTEVDVEVEHDQLSADTVAVIVDEVKRATHL